MSSSHAKHEQDLGLGLGLGVLVNLGLGLVSKSILYQYNTKIGK